MWHLVSRTLGKDLSLASFSSSLSLVCARGYGININVAREPRYRTRLHKHNYIQIITNRLPASDSYT